MADPLVGRTIAQYEIVTRVGGGAMGVVYKARDTRLGRDVALKFLPPEWSHDETAKQRFLREAQAASSTNHPNICTIHDLGTTDEGQLFIVMAYYEGPTLKQRIESGPMAIEEALDFATQIADGLAKAHAQGVVHRDIKPGNVILTEDGVRILDFGLATFADALKLTAENTPVGTPAYMSPEQGRGLTTDARTDVWAAGVVLYEMLAGHVPFQGSHAEVIAHAVRTEAPAPLRISRPEIPEEIEQLVFRAMHKEPGVRFQDGRALARALRQVRGLSLPLDLRTGSISVPQAAARGSRSVKRSVVAAAVTVAAVGGVVAWLWTRTESTRIIVAPLINVTGISELEPFRLALTHTLSSELSESGTVRVVPYVQMLGRIRKFMVTGSDVSGPEAMKALIVNAPDALVLVPSLVYENDLWRGRVEIRRAGTGVRVATIETDAVPSALPKDVAYDLVIELADRVRQHLSQGRLFSSPSRPPGARLRTLDAASAYEQGIRAFDELEYATARSMFAKAATLDPANPMPLAWLSRVALLMRQPNESRDAAERALRLVNDQTPAEDRALVQAMAAEARRDEVAAGARYQELADRSADRMTGLMEFGGFLDRSGQDEKAVSAYQDALAVEATALRPHLELCRLYSPSRLNQPARADEHGRRALAEYRFLGDGSLEAQALFCLTDVLRMGDETRREEGRVSAESALQLLQALPDHTYSLARAYNYAALAADAQRRSGDALALWEKSLSASRTAGNTALEPLVLMNLGVTYEAVGYRGLAFDHYQQSMNAYEELGDPQRAAQSRANVGALLIENGGKPDEGLKYIKNVLPVFRAANNKDFELFALRATAWYYRNAGLYRQAEIELNKATAIATASGLSRKVAPLEIDLARSVMDRGDYGGARAQLLKTLGDGSGPDSGEARIRLAAVQVRLGEFDAASDNLRQASDDMDRSGRRGLLPVILLTQCELAYEAGSDQDARSLCSRASALWTDAFPDPASVEARAFIGLLDGLRGSTREAERVLRASLEQAEQMNRVVIQGRARVFLARLYVLAKRGRDAIETLAEFPADGEIPSNPEVLAQAHYWRSRALLLVGDPASARIEASRAKAFLEAPRINIPERYRSTFSARRDIRPLLE